MGFENDDKRHNDLINVKETEWTIHRNWQHWVHKTQDEDNPETLQLWFLQLQLSSNNHNIISTSTIIKQ